MELTQENVEKLNVAKMPDALLCKGLLLDAIEAGDKLEAENERLKAELKQTEAQDQVVFDGLRKENAKLKCLILHLFGLIGFYASEWYSEYDEERQVRRAVKWWKIHIKYNKAYLKAKKALREGSNA